MNEKILTTDKVSIDSGTINDFKDYIVSSSDCSNGFLLNSAANVANDSAITTLSSALGVFSPASSSYSDLWSTYSSNPYGTSGYYSYEDHIYNMTEGEVLETIKKIFYENGYNLLENPDPIKEASNLRGWTVYGKLIPIRGSRVLGAEIDQTKDILSAYDEITLETDNEVFFDKFKIKITPSTGLVFVDDNISDYYKMDEEADLIISQLQKITEDIRESLVKKDDSDDNSFYIKSMGTTSQTYINKNLCSSINYTAFNSALGTIIDNTPLTDLNTGN